MVEDGVVRLIAGLGDPVERLQRASELLEVRRASVARLARIRRDALKELAAHREPPVASLAHALRMTPDEVAALLDEVRSVNPRLRDRV